MSSDTIIRPVRPEIMYAAFMLRLWIGMRLFFAGLDKFRVKGETTFSMDAYKDNVQVIADTIAEFTPLTQQMCDLYAAPLGYLLVGIGVLVMLGLFTRLSLLAAGVMFVSLGVGLMLLPDDFEAVMIGIQVAITAFALSLWWHDRLSVDGVLGRLFGCGQRSNRKKKDAADAPSDSPDPATSEAKPAV